MSAVWKKIWDSAEQHILEVLHFKFQTLYIRDNIVRKNTEINVFESKSDCEELDSEHEKKI